MIWLFVGWEAVAQLAGDFTKAETDLPRAMAMAFGVVTMVYVGLAIATIGVTAGTGSRVPLADLIAVGFGRAGRDATAVLAVALTMGTMNVYIGGAAKLATSLAQNGACRPSPHSSRSGCGTLRDSAHPPSSIVLAATPHFRAPRRATTRVPSKRSSVATRQIGPTLLAMLAMATPACVVTVTDEPT